MTSRDKAAAIDTHISADIPLVKEVSSSSEETIAVSPSQEASASTLRLVKEPASAPSVSLRSVNSPLHMAEGRSIASGVVDEVPITVPNEDPDINGGFEHQEAVAPGDEGPSLAREGEPVLNEQPTIVAEGVSDEGVSTAQGVEAGPSEQPRIVVLSVMTEERRLQT
ncbi:hypothetical protein AMTR_s00108p00028700 [Amborella trichopoda]|uniref:Uncharacterized protein n=1 Tax=Amborella trichopoda TaxID=13333 RepID=W1NXB6_AMBTC|nr:hypothetical protein AMTR_s00108p00028700 [Amborella trichopoda]